MGASVKGGVRTAILDVSWESPAACPTEFVGRVSTRRLTARAALELQKENEPNLWPLIPSLKNHGLMIRAETTLPATAGCIMAASPCANAVAAGTFDPWICSSNPVFEWNLISA